MYFIIYTSEANGNPAEKDFRHLLKQCHANNQKLNITGLLLYLNGQFMQIIEGEKENIQALYRVICQDSRHQKVVLLEEGEQKGRNFPDWAMGFKAVSGDQNLAMPAFINLNENELFFNLESPTTHPALPHLKKFYSQLNFGQEYIQF